MSPLITHDETTLPIHRRCELTGIARSSYYRHLATVPGDALEEIELRDLIQFICIEINGYGYRRVTESLHGLGYKINHKRVLGLMRKDNLLCLRKKKWIRTTDSSHGYRIYPNLASGLIPHQPNQLWVADITYIRLVREFVYLAVILDVFSRRAIGWALSRHIDTNLSLTALRMALATRDVVPGLIHHSDRGVQYAATDYTDLLKQNNIAISMSRRGNPYDNAYAESFMKTLKYEEVLLNEYETFEEAKMNLSRFIEIVYNRKRLHSSLGYRSPERFETDFTNSLYQKQSTLTTDLTVSF
jgi:transposase InsO family protein